MVGRCADVLAARGVYELVPSDCRVSERQALFGTFHRGCAVCGVFESFEIHTVIVDHADDVHQVAPRLGRAHAGHHLVLFGRGKERRRQRRRYVRRLRRRRSSVLCRRLHAVDHLHQLGRHREAVRLLRVVVGRGARLDGAAFGVEEEIRGIKVLVLRLPHHRLRDDELPCADDFGLERELFERGDEARRLEDGGNGRDDVATGVGRRLEEDLGVVVLAVGGLVGGGEDAVLAAVAVGADVEEGDVVLAQFLRGYTE